MCRGECINVDIKEAYEVLGIEEGTDKRAIEKKYEVLIKKYKFVNAEQADAKTAKDTLDNINVAYRFLIGKEIADQQEKDKKNDNKRENIFIKLLGLDPEKVNNFFYYHKFHILVSIAIIIVLTMLVYSIVTKPNPDLTIAYIGSTFNVPMDEKISTQIESKYKEAKTVNIEIVKKDDTMEVTSKITVLMAASDTDVFILDESIFKTFGNEGAFANLDNIIGSAVNNTKIKTYLLKTDLTNKEHLYGLDVTNNPALKDEYIIGTKIAVINPRAKHPDQAAKFMKFLLKIK